MTEWFTALPAFTISAAFLMLPGLALAFSLGLRGLWAWSTAPAISMTMYTLGSIVLPKVGLSWTPLTALGFCVVFGALVFLLFRFVLKKPFAQDGSASGQLRWATVGGWAIGAVVVSGWIIAGVGNPESISQTFDNVFHLNAIAYINSTGNASPLAIGALTAPGTSGGFYPVGWHGMVALVEQVSGASIALSLNAFNLAAAALVWPTGMMILVRQLAGPSRSAMLVTGILSAAFPAFPLNMLYFGVLYPYFFGLTLVPVTVAVLLQMLGTTRDTLLGSKAGLIVLFLGIVPGLALTHPTAMMTVLAMSVPVVIVAMCTNWTRISSKQRVARVVGVAVFAVVGFLMLVKLRPGVMWDPRTDELLAVWRTLSLQLGGYGMPLFLGIMTLLGVIVALVSRKPAAFAAVGSWIVIALLHAVVSGGSNPVIRGITGVWYGDTPRLEAAMPLVAIPLAVIGIEFIWSGIRKIGSRTLVNVLGAAGLVIVFVVTQIGSGLANMAQDMRTSYEMNAQSVLLSDDERALLDRVKDEVPADEMIIGNPWTGTSLALAFSDREVVMPHILMQLHGSRSVVMHKLRFADENPEVCDAVRDLNARWVLDFGSLEVHGASHIYDGLDKLENSDVVKLVDQQGEAKLYKVTACG